MLLDNGMGLSLEDAIVLQSEKSKAADGNASRNPESLAEKIKIKRIVQNCASTKAVSEGRQSKTKVMQR